MPARWTLTAIVPALAAAIAIPWSTSEPPIRTVAASPQGTDAPVMPAYDASRALVLPEGYREWVFVGSSLGLSYDAGASGHEMFHETLMEPTAYRHFVKTGAFREGSMFVLMLHGVERAVLPGRSGRFAGALHGVEMAVKDAARTPEGWAYYDFGGTSGAAAATAQPEGAASCFACHERHGARDNVFLQFYPLLAQAAGLPVAVERTGAAMPHDGRP